MLLVADNLQITRREIAQAIRHRNPGPLRSYVMALQEAGAQAIDINTGPLGRYAAEEMSFCVKTVQDVSDLPLLLDTVNPVAMRAGLDANRKTAAINGISMEPTKLDTILPLAVEYNVDVVGFLLDGRSQMPRQLEDRLALALELFQRCREAGLRSEQLVFDPVVAPLIWEDGLHRNRDLLEIIRRLPEILDFPIRTVVGLSNLTTGQGASLAKQQVEKIFLCMLASAGLSWVLMDIHRRESVVTAHNCRLLLDASIFAWEAVEAG